MPSYLEMNHGDEKEISDRLAIEGPAREPYR